MRRVWVLLLAGASCLAQAPQRLLPFDAQVHRQILVENRGKVVLLNFWATWCAPCREEMPQLVALEQKFRARGFRLITVSADEPADAAQALEFLKKTGVPAPAYIKSVRDDDQLIRAIDPKWSGALPALFLYDRSGKMVARFVGETSILEIRKAIERIL